MATPVGAQRPSALPLGPSKSHALVVKMSPCPNTVLADAPLESGAVYSSTLLSLLVRDVEIARTVQRERKRNA